MKADLDALAAACGIEPTYLSARGEVTRVPEESRRLLLEIMGVEDDDPARLARRANAAAGDAGSKCFVPGWLRRGRCWGMTCQVYGLRSARNWGIGDFADLGTLVEIVGAAGGDFLGLSPIHALFPVEPQRYSPYSPSTRASLNVLHVAPDLEPEYAGLSARDDAQRVRLAEADLVDYPAVARAKLRLFDRMYGRFLRQADAERTRDFDTFRQRRGAALLDACLFDALAEHMRKQHGRVLPFMDWPARYRRRDSEDVERFLEAQGERVRFYVWLQWLADSQLARVQDRALAAGMRIGLLVDFAVGVAADSALAWADPDLIMRGAHIGAPPDVLNTQGQDWGLVPPSPVTLASRDAAPLRDDLSACMAHAGCMRLDHAMTLKRLFWIPSSRRPAEGGYVRYPFDALVREVAAVSHEKRCMVIGEALGTVPEGFVSELAAAEIQAYRVLLFEQRRDGAFRKPRALPRRAFACVSTHDLPTFTGWWIGRDIDWRRTLGLLDEDEEAAQRAGRARDRSFLIEALRAQRLWSKPAPKDDAGREALLVAAHRYVAASPARLAAVQLEDALGEIEQPNLPGQTEPHPNWRRRMSVPLEGLAAHRRFKRLAAAMRECRPKP